MLQSIIPFIERLIFSLFFSLNKNSLNLYYWDEPITYRIITMPHAITTTITELNTLLAQYIPTLSRYAFGYSYGDRPVMDSGEPTPVDTFINNGLCHVYALLVYARVVELGLTRVGVVGSPTHVFLEHEGRFYDAAWPAGTDDLSDVTTWPETDLIDYLEVNELYAQFPSVDEARTVLSMLANTPYARAYHTTTRFLSVIPGAH